MSGQRQFVFGAGVAVAVVISIALGRAGGGTAIQPAAFAATQPASAAAKTLTFSGTGSVRVKPDTAQISFTTGGEGATKSDAVNAATRAMRSVLSALDRGGVRRADTRTTMDAYQDTSRGVYVASEYLDVTVHDARAAGRLLAAGLRAGAASASGPQYSVQDRDRGYDAALRAAVADARTHAEAAASLIGAEVTGVQSIEETPPVAGVYAAADAVREVQALPVRPGTDEVSVSVTVSFGFAGG
jgi:uncharacterized protein YggE